MVSPAKIIIKTSHSDAGSVMLELFFGIGILLLFTAAVVDFGLGFQNYGGAVNAARDLARTGAGYDLDALGGGGETMTACEFVCSRATSSLCTYGLGPGTYAVNVQRSTNWPEMLAVDVSRTGPGLIIWQFSILPTASAAFTMEGPLAEVEFNPRGCGECTLGGCT